MKRWLNQIRSFTTDTLPHHTQQASVHLKEAELLQICEALRQFMLANPGQAVLSNEMVRRLAEEMRLDEAFVQHTVRCVLQTG
jgi:hypothetical protein